jgi:hypothetical protein
LDWVDQMHYRALCGEAAALGERGELPNTPAAVEVWAGQREQRFGGEGCIAVAIAQTRGAVVAMWSQYAYSDLSGTAVHAG